MAKIIGTKRPEKPRERRKLTGNIIAVDFDGTLCASAFPDIGAPNIPLIDLLIARRRNGCRVLLWTCRVGEQLEAAVSWCRMFGLEFDAVNENLPEINDLYGNETRKIYADVYLDDKAARPEEVI